MCDVRPTRSGAATAAFIGDLVAAAVTEARAGAPAATAGTGDGSKGKGKGKRKGAAGRLCLMPHHMYATVTFQPRVCLRHGQCMT